MQMLYGYDVAADLAPQTRYDEVVKALGGAGETVTDPRQIGPALDRAFAAGRALPGQRDHRRRRGLPARHVRRLSRPCTVRLGRVARRARGGGRGSPSRRTPATCSAPDDPYLDRLRDAAPRAREAELWVAVDEADGHACSARSPYCPPGSPWREVAPARRGRVPDAGGRPRARRPRRGRGAGASMCLDALAGSGCPAVRALHAARTCRRRTGSTSGSASCAAPDARLVARARASTCWPSELDLTGVSPGGRGTSRRHHDAGDLARADQATLLARGDGEPDQPAVDVHHAWRSPRPRRPTADGAWCSSATRVPTLVSPASRAGSSAAQVAASQPGQQHGGAEHRQAAGADGRGGVGVADGALQGGGQAARPAGSSLTGAAPRTARPRRRRLLDRDAAEDDVRREPPPVGWNRPVQPPTRKASATRSRSWSRSSSQRRGGQREHLVLHAVRADPLRGLADLVEHGRRCPRPTRRCPPAAFQDPRTCAGAKAVRSSARSHSTRARAGRAASRARRLDPPAPVVDRDALADHVVALEEHGPEVECRIEAGHAPILPGTHKSPGPTGPGLVRTTSVIARADAQALGRLPWFAPFFLRARRLRPVLPMGSSCGGSAPASGRERRTSSQAEPQDANRVPRASQPRVGADDLDLHLADRDHHPVAQRLGRLLAAGPRDQRLDGALEVVARQARPALVEVVLICGAVGLVELVVEEEEDPSEDLGAVGVVDALERGGRGGLGCGRRVIGRLPCRPRPWRRPSRPSRSLSRT